MMALSQKLTRKEIDSALNKIRKKYTEYISFYSKNPDILNRFEDRYRQAVNQNMDLTLFISDEMILISGLLKKEQNIINNQTKHIQSDPQKKMSFGDKVLEKLQKKMARYPGLNLPGDAIPDIEHLYGALYLIDQKYWFPAITILSKKSSGWSGSNLGPLEQELQLLAPTAARPVPKALDRYVYLLNENKPNLKELSLEARRVIAQASFFLHKIDQLLDKSILNDAVNIKEVENLSLLVKNIIADFRLKDIK